MRSNESLAYFLYRAVFVRRSLCGWRELRPTRREIVLAVLFLIAFAVFIWIAVETALSTHCLTNPRGPKCEGGWFSK